MRQTTTKNSVRSAALVGERVRMLREMARMTQREVSLLMGMQAHQISKIEHGIRALRMDELARMAQALGCKVSALVAPLDAEARR